MQTWVKGVILKIDITMWGTTDEWMGTMVNGWTT
jgi:hypothetical protein